VLQTSVFRYVTHLPSAASDWRAERVLAGAERTERAQRIRNLHALIERAPAPARGGVGESSGPRGARRPAAARMSSEREAPRTIHVVALAGAQFSSAHLTHLRVRRAI
jgi:hypothetical protein